MIRLIFGPKFVVNLVLGILYLLLADFHLI